MDDNGTGVLKKAIKKVEDMTDDEIRDWLHEDEKKILRSIIYLLVKQLGGSVDINLLDLLNIHYSKNTTLKISDNNQIRTISTGEI